MTAPLTGGTIRALHLAIVDRLDEIVRPFDWLLTKDGATRVPDVRHGFLPPKTPTAEQFPFVIVRPRSGDDTPQSATQDAEVMVELVIGVYRDLEDGWLDAIDVVDAIRASLGEEPVIDGTAFEHVGPMKWQLLDTELPPPRPQWLVFVTTTWQIPRPRRVEERNPEPVPPQE